MAVATLTRGRPRAAAVPVAVRDVT